MSNPKLQKSMAPIIDTYIPVRRQAISKKLDLAYSKAFSTDKYYLTYCIRSCGYCTLLPILIHTRGLVKRRIIWAINYREQSSSCGILPPPTADNSQLPRLDSFVVHYVIVSMKFSFSA